MAVQDYNPRDNLWILVRKILQNLAGIADGSFPIPFTPGSGGPITTNSNVTIAVTGTAVLAIPANEKGYIVAAQGNAASLFVGDSTVTNGGAKRGIELSMLGFSPLLTGPVYVNGTAGDIAGVTIV